MLEFGQYLARELGVNNGVDTIGRWMAHYLAELIDKAENSPSEGERGRARKEAIQTILKIWEHRELLPGNAYPLNSYRNILIVFESLTLENNPFLYFSGDKIDRLSSSLLVNMAQLIPALLLMKVQEKRSNKEIDGIAIENLNEAEQHILRIIYHWFEIFEPISKDQEQIKSGVEEYSEKENYKTERITLELIESADKIIDEIRIEIHKKIGMSPAVE